MLVCNLMAITAPEAAQTLGAQTDLTKALKQAKSENKLLLLVVVKEHCHWCEKMVYNTLKDKNIQEHLSEMITVVIDINDKVSDDFKTAQAPAVFFIDPNKQKSVWANVGYIKKGTFLIDIISANEMMDSE